MLQTRHSETVSEESTRNEQSLVSCAGSFSKPTEKLLPRMRLCVSGLELHV